MMKQANAVLALIFLTGCGLAPTSEQRAVESNLSSNTTALQLPLRESEDATFRWFDYRQIDRRSYQESFAIPNFLRQAADSYTETRVVPPLDILIVMDSSSSMGPYQSNLAGRMSDLLNFIAFADWRIHVVTTDTDNPGFPHCPSRGTISKGEPNFAQRFATAVTPGTGGDGNERGSLAALLSLTAPCPGEAPWMRPNSTLAILFVSDEYDQSPSQSAPLINYLRTIRTLGDTARLYGILNYPTGTTACLSNSSTSGYREAIIASGGICGSVADSSYSATLSRISADVSSLLPPSISLQQLPVNGQVTVTVDGVTVPPTGYRVQGQDLFLTQSILAGQSVLVSYDYAIPFSRDFSLANPAAADTIQLQTSTTTLAAGDFSYSSTNQTVTVNSVVTPNQPFTVTYKQNIPLRTVFYIGELDHPDTLRCFLNAGSELHDFSYDHVQLSVVFTRPPTELQSFKCSVER